MSQTYPLPPPPPHFSHRIWTNWKIDLEENWGGRVLPNPPRGAATACKYVWFLCHFGKILKSTEEFYTHFTF